MSKSRITRLAALPLAGALAFSLAACEGEQAEFEADVDDQSGGEFIVGPEDPNAVPVELPRTEMTNVPQDEMGEDGMAAERVEGMDTAAE